MEERELLHCVHCARYRAHYGASVDLSRFPWPTSDADWRKTPHGAPWDTNVEMARWHLALAKQMQADGLLA